MATVNSVGYTKFAATPSQKVGRGSTWQGRKYIAYDEYEASSTVSGTVIRMCKVPAGAKIVDGQIWWDDLGAGVTLKVGDQYDDDRFLTAMNAHETPSAGFPCGRFNVVGDVTTAHGIGIGYEYTCEQDILVTVGGGTATGTIKLAVEYLVN